MRILLVGAGGQLGTDFQRCLANEDVVALTHDDLDICDAAAVQDAVRRIRPDCVLNTAAFNLVDACEERRDEAFAINTLGPGHLARAAQSVRAVMVHFSTNYVFDGEKRAPYVEADLPRPLSIYAMSKLAGEWMVQQQCEKHFVVRTAALYGMAGNRSKGGNFIERIVERAERGESLQVVDDQFVNPTCTRELAERFRSLLGSGRYGLYHMVNAGGCSWYELIREAFRLLGITVDVGRTTTQALGAPARRPLYSVLETRALRVAGFPDLRPWPEALAEYLRERWPDRCLT